MIHRKQPLWRHWIGTGAIVALLTFVALAHEGDTSRPRVRLIPFREYVEATACLMQGCMGSREWLLMVLIDGLGNLVVFMPLGAALDYTLRDTIPPPLKRIGTIALSGAILSVTYEIVQLWIPGRVTATDDVIINTMGTVLGAVLMLALRRHRQQPDQNTI